MAPNASASGRLIHAHLDWVVNNRREARFLFEISRNEWSEAVRDAQRARNARLAEGIERWRAPLVARGEASAASIASLQTSRGSAS